MIANMRKVYRPNSDDYSLETSYDYCCEEIKQAIDDRFIGNIIKPLISKQ